MTTVTPEERDSFDRGFSAGRLALVLGILLLAYYPGILLGTRVFYYRDAGLFSYPVADYFRSCFWHGQWPLWNPYNHCGIPFLAQWNTLCLYPGSLIYLLLPFPWSVNVYLVGHLFLGAIGAYHLARHWFGSRLGGMVAGLALAWSGLTITFLGWLSHEAALAWMPWVILYLERAGKEGRRMVFRAALLGACQMLCGSPEIVLLTWVFGLANFGLDAWQRRQSIGLGIARFAGSAGLVTALSAAQLLPWLDLVAHGDRSAATAGDAWSMPPWGAANFLVPLFRMVDSLSGVFMQGEQQMVATYYAGILCLLLALIAIWRRTDGKTRLLAVFAVLGVALAMGEKAILLPAIRRMVPVLGFTRYPIKFIFFTNFSLALLAGAGAAWLQRQSLAVIHRCALMVGGILAAGVLVVASISYRSPVAGELWNTVWPNALQRIALLAMGGMFLGAVFYWRHRVAAYGWLLLMGLDICTHMPNPNPPITSEVYAHYLPPNMSHVPRWGESRAMLSAETDRIMGQLVHPNPVQYYVGQRAELLGDCNLFNRIPVIGGFFGVHLAFMQRVAKLAAEAAPPNLIAFLGVSELAVAHPLFDWQFQRHFLPIATIGQRPLFRTDDGTLRVLASPEFNPQAVVCLPPEAQAANHAVGDPSAQVISSQFGAQRCLLQTSAQRNTTLVIAQAYYHCWKAEIDGHPTPLWRANEAFQALVVPSGRHTVRLVYVDRLFELGAVVSILALLVCVIGNLRPNRYANGGHEQLSSKT